MFSGNKTIQLISYTPDSVKKIGVRLVESGEIETTTFSARKLMMALARTILAMQPKDPQLIYQAISSYSALYPLISDKEEFSFIADVDQKVRDYLLSTRTGELAPAMSYLFAQEQLQRPFVVDFASVLNDETVQAHPDLLAVDTKGNASILESKGSRDIRNKGKLREALLQSEKATIFSNIVANDFYALFISITKSTSDVTSAIHFTNTTNELEPSEQDVRAIIYRHYATWFMLLGYTKEAEQLAQGKPIKLKKLKKVVSIKKDNYYVLDSSNSLFLNTCKEWDSQLREVYFTISEQVLNYLGGEESLELPKQRHVQKVNKKYTIFADGTAMYMQGK